MKELRKTNKATILFVTSLCKTLGISFCVISLSVLREVMAGGCRG